MCSQVVSRTMRRIIILLLVHAHLTSSFIPAGKTLKFAVSLKRRINFGVHSTTAMRIRSDVYFRPINNDHTIVSVLMDNVRVSIERQNGHVIQLRDCPSNAPTFEDLRQPYLAYLTPVENTSTIAGNCPLEWKILQTDPHEGIVIESGIADVTHCNNFNIPAGLQSSATHCGDNVCSPNTELAGISYVDRLVRERYGDDWANTFIDVKQFITFSPFINKDVHAYSLLENRIELKEANDFLIPIPEDCTRIIQQITPNRVVDEFCYSDFGQQRNLQDLIFLYSAQTCQYLFWPSVIVGALQCYR